MARALMVQRTQHRARFATPRFTSAEKAGCAGPRRSLGRLSRPGTQSMRKLHPPPVGHEAVGAHVRLVGLALRQQLVVVHRLDAALLALVGVALVLASHGLPRAAAGSLTEA